MPCYRPLKAYRANHVNESGKRGIVFKAKDGFVDMPIDLPCGRCIGCRLERSRQWAMRCVHEASMYEENSFVTLTYNNESLPKDRSLDVRHLQLFFKRLRKSEPEKKIRFFACGEYGEKTRRPHYHAIIFNHSFPDKRHLSGSGPDALYYSPTLDKVWGNGHTSVGSVTFESAAYVARYIVKKVLGDAAEEHYWWFDRETAEWFSLKPEFAVMSRGGRGRGSGGIGKTWLDDFKDDLYIKDYVHMRGVPMNAPRYYDKLLERMDPARLRYLKDQRVKSAKRNKDDNTYERLVAKEKVKFAQLTQLKRELE